jgi:hypothetical protein
MNVLMFTDKITLLVKNQMVDQRLLAFGNLFFLSGHSTSPFYMIGNDDRLHTLSHILITSSTL